jgi:hypothetical protein
MLLVFDLARSLDLAGKAAHVVVVVAFVVDVTDQITETSLWESSIVFGQWADR